MFIDFLTLMMINLAAGLGLLAGWLFLDFETRTAKNWSIGFAMSGFLALITGLYMSLTWPLPGSYNIVFGEMSVLFGTIMLGLAFAVYKEFDLMPVCIYSSFSGLVVILMGLQIILLPLTKEPVVSGLSFTIVGVLALLAAPGYLIKSNIGFRKLAATGLLLMSLLWCFNAAMSYWGHVGGSFLKWKPVVMQYEIEMNKPKK